MERISHRLSDLQREDFARKTNEYSQNCLYKRSLITKQYHVPTGISVIRAAFVEQKYVEEVIHGSIH